MGSSLNCGPFRVLDYCGQGQSEPQALNMLGLDNFRELPKSCEPTSPQAPALLALARHDLKPGALCLKPQPCDRKRFRKAILQKPERPLNTKPVSFGSCYVGLGFRVWGLDVLRSQSLRRNSTKNALGRTSLRRFPASQATFSHPGEPPKPQGLGYRRLGFRGSRSRALLHEMQGFGFSTGF